MLAFVATLVTLAKKMALPFLPLYGECLRIDMSISYYFGYHFKIVFSRTITCPSQLGQGFGLRESCWLGAYLWILVPAEFNVLAVDRIFAISSMFNHQITALSRQVPIWLNI